MRISMLALTATAVALILGGVSESWSGQKPSFKTPNWRCKVEFRDRDPDPNTNTNGDAIRSDGLGPYVDGVDGVTCYINPGTDGATRDGWLYMIIESPRRSPSPRFIQFRGQEYEQASGNIASYLDFPNQVGGSFEVMGLGKVQWPSRDVIPFRALLSHSQFPYGARLNGDSNTVGSLWDIPPTSSVFVQALDELECSWEITSYTTEQAFFTGLFGERSGTQVNPRVMRISKGQGSKLPDVVLGDFPMPFQVTISIIANKPECPVP